MEPWPQRFCPPSELGNPQRTRVPTLRRRLRLPNRTNCQTRVNLTFFQILVQNHLVSRSGYPPVPTRGRFCSPFVALVNSRTFPCCKPAAVGLNQTSMPQVAPIASSVPQLFAARNPPDASIRVIFNGAFPMLVNRMGFGLLLLPTVTDPKLRRFGRGLIAGNRTGIIAKGRQPGYLST
jgi:hypothetical protein